MSKTKFYIARNAARDIAGQRFEVYDVTAGTAFGVFRTDDEAIAAELDKLVKAGKSGVDSITEAEYQACLKKKPRRFESYPSSNVSQPPGPPLKGQVAATVTEGPHETVEPENKVIEVSQIESADQAIATGKKGQGKKAKDQPPVEPPQT